MHTFLERCLGRIQIFNCFLPITEAIFTLVQGQGQAMSPLFHFWRKDHSPLKTEPEFPPDSSTNKLIEILFC